MYIRTHLSPQAQQQNIQYSLFFHIHSTLKACSHSVFFLITIGPGEHSDTSMDKSELSELGEVRTRVAYTILSNNIVEIDIFFISVHPNDLLTSGYRSLHSKCPHKSRRHSRTESGNLAHHVRRTYTLLNMYASQHTNCA